MKTWKDLLDYLSSLDEITLLEKLNIYSFDLVNRFEDFIEDKKEELLNELDEIEEEEEQEWK
jgi:hypothetical protein